MPLADRVHIARRFQRSIRIDTDLGDKNALDGFVCPASSGDVLRTMARHVSETGQGAFTWTGPYGSGKSSLVVVLSALLSGNKRLRKQAEATVGPETALAVQSALEPKSKGWCVIPVVGRRDNPADVIGEALEHSPDWDGEAPEKWTETLVLEALEGLSKASPRSSGGLILFLDEMGKFLEAAARDGADVYLFQQLAELASRSHGRLIVIGVLHQAFEEYAHRLSREMRDEWSKIQGRFIDLSVNVAGEEQLELLSRAIESDWAPERPGKLAQKIADIISASRPGVSLHIGVTLENCWPLHPIVSASLGPISRRRFGQNQRSVFGFLNSSETGGFQDHLRHATDEELYSPAQLWDYLHLNLESSILASPDGHRWSVAFEAIERCDGLGGNELQVNLLKTIALVDLFKDRSGLIANTDLLKVAAPEATERELKDAIAQLENWSLIVYRKFASSYAVFAGSDFDIDEAVINALEEVDEIDLDDLHKLAGVQPILAKRHYHRTGALRWFDVVISSLEEVETRVQNYEPSTGSIGQFIITLPTNAEAEVTAEDQCRAAARKADTSISIIGLSKRSWTITELARELAALEKVWTTSSELAGDSVARRELRARIAHTQSQLEEELQQALENALWYRKGAKATRLSRDELNQLASKLADQKFELAPTLKNELVNRIKPSTNAVAAQKVLLRRMVANEDEPRLGIEGFPAEGGLYASVLEATRLHRKGSGKWRLAAPAPNDDPASLLPLWQAASEYLEQHNDRAVSVGDIYTLWSAPPFGVKKGLLPIFLVAFVVSRRSKIAFYRQGIFQSNLDDLDIDYLTMNPDNIQLRWMDLPKISQQLLSDMADLVRQLDSQNTLENLEPIDVARGLIAIFDRLPAWTKRTMQLSKNAIRVRHIFKQASDPNKFLFDDIPGLIVDLDAEGGSDDLSSVVVHVREGLEELRNAYPTMLNRLRETLLSELQVPNASGPAISELRERAENILEIAGDFRLEAFVGRTRNYDGSDAATEAIASLAANKPLNDWVDPDINRAALGLAEMAQGFVRIEAFAHIKGRADKRHAMAVVVGLDGQPKTFSGEFSISDADRENVNVIVKQLDTALSKANPQERNALLASMAELIARHIDESTSRPIESDDDTLEEVVS
jgi:hypothetical protein